MNEAFFKALDRAIEAASKHERDLLAYPGVVAVGAGPRRKGGKLTGEAAIVITVHKKIGAPEKALPREIDSVPIDVIERGKPVEAPEIIAAQMRAKEVLERHRERWLRIPNVTGIGIGYKNVGGEPDFTRIALKIFVARKLREAELDGAGTTAVPPDIDGVITDVEEMPPLRPVGASGSRADRKEPLVAGCAVGVATRPFYYGTFGSIVFDRTTGEQLVLSNQHVLDAGVGTDVIQPSPVGLDDSFEFGFQLDICNPVHFFRVDTPNTTVGTILAGAALGAALAAALSDEIDPTRRGQEATAPPTGATTFRERQQVRLQYPELPIPGTHFKVATSWKYRRETSAGNFDFGADDKRQNPHALAGKQLFTDKKLYNPGETIQLYALVLPESCAPGHPDPRPLSEAEIEELTAIVNVTPPSLREGVRAGVVAASAPTQKRCPCERYHVTAVLTPTTVDRAFPVVLRQPNAAMRAAVYARIAQQVIHTIEDEKLRGSAFALLRHGCVYTGELTAANVPLGPWKHYLFVQTVNTATENMKPEEAAQIIGGLTVSQNSKPQLDVACGPFVYEDGQFDIELI